MLVDSRSTSTSGDRPVGNYAVLLKFSDGTSGIYSWEVLYALGRDRSQRREDLDALAAAGRSREA